MQAQSITSEASKAKLADERKELAKLLRGQRLHERNGLFELNQISRGVERAYLGVRGDGYNQIHGVDFYRELSGYIKIKSGIVRLLDVGCGLGYFLKDLAEFAEREGFSSRFEPQGITLNREFKCVEPYKGEVGIYKPVIGNGVFHVAHAENIPFPSNHFDMVVAAKGAYTYYDFAKASTNRKLKLLEELFRVTALHGRIYLSAESLRPSQTQLSSSPFNQFLGAHPNVEVLQNKTRDDTRLQLIKNGI